MKKIYLFAAMAAMLAACSENDLTVNEQPSKATETVEDAVNFDVYVGRGLTRGGVNGSITTDLLKQYSSDQTEANKAGFGVFGYYTNGEKYSGITKPNFFYNQQVTYGSTGWTYTPLKYWPNEFGSDAISDQVDRVSLFAYLPYVEVDPLTGTVKPAVESELTGTDAEKAIQRNQKDPTTNIIGMSRNNVTGDPFIKYVATMNAKNSVDLCYGVAAENFTSSNSALNQNAIEKGKPYIDVVKPGIDGKIKFDFKHATAQLKVKVDAVVNQANAQSAQNIDLDYTRIWIRSVTFEGITQKGSLNLNDGEWYDMNGTNKITTGTFTLYDGRKDGKEAILAATNELPSTINPIFVQSEAYAISTSTNTITKPTTQGVTNVAHNLFVNNSEEDPVFVIPTNEKMKVTIVYDVETVDPNLAFYLSDGATQGSTIENSITKTIDTFGNILAGYCYTLNLHLGMRTVDFEAEVTPWQYYGADVDLPSNLQTFAAGTTPNPKLTLPADGGTYQFAVSGLNVNAAPDVTSNFKLNGSTVSATATPVNGAGITIVTVSGISPNTSVNNITGSGDENQWVIDDGENSVTIDVTQLAAQLGMSVKSVSGGKTVTLHNQNGNQATWDEAITNAGDQTKFKVYRNGMLMSAWSSGGFADNQFKYTSADDATIEFKNDLMPGDIVTVWIKPGDAKEESVTANIAGASFEQSTVPYSGASDSSHDLQWPTIIGAGTLTNWKSTNTTYVASIDASNRTLTLGSGTGTGSSAIQVTFTPAEGYYLADGSGSKTIGYIASVTIE